MSPRNSPPRERALNAAADRGHRARHRQRAALPRRRKRHAARLETSPGVRCERFSVPIAQSGCTCPPARRRCPPPPSCWRVPARRRRLPGARAVHAAERATAVRTRRCWSLRAGGLDRVFKVGGAQAIAAMAYGTASIPRCDKIFGPGNAWVTAAKMLVAQDRPVPRRPAGGPSEVLVIADDSARAGLRRRRSAGAGGAESGCAIVAGHDLRRACRGGRRADRAPAPRPVAPGDPGAVARGHAAASRRRPRDGLRSRQRLCPRALLLEIREPRRWLRRVERAGAVFLGQWSPECMGDYCSGPNQPCRLTAMPAPTAACRLRDFSKRITRAGARRPPGSRARADRGDAGASRGTGRSRRAVSVRLAVLPRSPPGRDRSMSSSRWRAPR